MALLSLQRRSCEFLYFWASSGRKLLGFAGFYFFKILPLHCFCVVALDIAGVITRVALVFWSIHGCDFLYITICRFFFIATIKIHSMYG